MECDLSKKNCVPCRGGVPPLTDAALQELLRKLGNGWQLGAERHLEKEFKFKNFKQALDFTNQVGQVAENQGHHPDIELGWGRVKVTLWTHKVNGLTENDFILAAKVDLIPLTGASGAA